MTELSVPEVNLTTVMLSAMRALLGAVTPNIRQVGMKWDDERFTLVCVHDGPADEDLQNEMGVVETEITAGFWPFREVRARLVRLDAPTPIRLEFHRVYARKEIAFLSV